MPAVQAGPRPRPGEPSWARVIANTVVLWFERHTRRPRQPGQGRLRWVMAVSLLLVVGLAALAGVALAHDSAKTPAKPGGAARRPGTGQGGINQVLTAQAARAQAAGWIAAQVGRNAIVSCDPVMCEALQGRGYPASDLDVLSPAAPDPLDSDVIVATSVLRSQFGARLTTVYAPVVLASFGAGGAVVQVRAVAPDGGPVYLQQLSADLTARKSYGGQLANNRNITAAPAARQQLEFGKVDSRLIAVIAALAQSHKLGIVSFSGAAPGASAELPLRSVIVTSRASGSTVAKTLESLRSFLKGQQPPYLPALTQFVKLPSGQQALSIQFPLPYPLGLLGTARSQVKIPVSR
jgi:hypothetical protein